MTQVDIWGGTVFFDGGWGCFLVKSVGKGAKRNSSLSLFTTKKKKKLPEPITEAAKLQITAKFWALLLLLRQPSIQEQRWVVQF